MLAHSGPGGMRNNDSVAAASKPLVGRVSVVFQTSSVVASITHKQVVCECWCVRMCVHEWGWAPCAYAYMKTPYMVWVYMRHA